LIENAKIEHGPCPQSEKSMTTATRRSLFRAGKLEGEDPEKRMIKEIEEELGYRIDKLDQLFELYMSPASFMEKITFFTCRYSPVDKVSKGGGLADEGEDIEVTEIDLEKACAMIGNDIVDAKTVILIQHLNYRLHQT
jgi:8-oxo-dGTP pyrophosphatase MutT (NUDIX family)